MIFIVYAGQKCPASPQAGWHGPSESSSLPVSSGTLAIPQGLASATSKAGFKS